MSYTTFQAELVDQLNRDDLTSQIPIFIKDAECRLNRELIVPDREATATLVMTTGSVALPADYWGMRSIYVDAATDVPLKQMSLSELHETYATATTGTPRNYAIQAGATLLVGPPPPSSTSVVINYYQAIPPLASNATNWLLTTYQDLYRAAALTEAYLFVMDEERAAKWDSRTMAKIREVQKSGQHRQYGAAPLAARGPNPSIRRVRA